MLFATTTISKIYLIYGFDASSQTVRDYIKGKLTAIETVSPELPPLIEGLITLIDQKTTDYDPSARYLIQADVLKWLGGQGLGAQAGIDDLKALLLGVLGLKGYDGGSGAGVAKFIRTDRLRHPMIGGCWRRY